MAYIGASPANRPIQTSDIEDGAVSVAKLSSTLDLSSNTITLPNGVVTSAALASGVGGSLVKLYETTISSSVASLSIDGYYTSDYKNYQLIITNLTTTNTGGNNTLRFRVNQSGTAQTGSDYWHIAAYNDRNTSANGDGGSGNHQDTSAYIGWQSNSSTFTCNATLDIFNPLSTSTYKSFLLHSQTYDYQPYSYSLVGNAYHKSTTASSGLTILHLNGNLTGGTVKLYGVG